VSKPLRKRLPRAVRQRFRPVKHLIYRPLYRLYPITASLNRPVFVIGCGRSGTTILATTLSQHPYLVYLQEPRHIWAYEPRTDIWSRTKEVDETRLSLAAGDVTPEAAARIRRAFGVEVERHGGQRLLEKLPINNFRVPFVDAIFPDAVFIHILRNGIEVARSIARLADAGRWYGGNKWSLLAAYARQRGDGDLLALCTDNFTRGLLEWRVSVSAALEGLAPLDPDRVLDARYENLLADPVGLCRRVEDFLALRPSQELETYAATQIARRSPPAGTDGLTPAARQIAGDLLAQLGYPAA